MMKKIFFIALLCVGIYGNQILANYNPKLFFGFNGNFGAGQVALFAKDKGYSYEFNPTAGIVAWKDLAFGISCDLKKAHTSGSALYNFHESGVGPFLRYYIHINDHHALFPFFLYSFGNSSSVNSNSIYDMNFNVIGTASSEIKGSNKEISPGLGYAFFINEHVSLEALYSFNIRTENQSIYVNEVSTTGTSESTFILDASRKYSKLSVGLLFYFNLKKE